MSRNPAVLHLRQNEAQEVEVRVERCEQERKVQKKSREVSGKKDQKR